MAGDYWPVNAEGHAFCPSGDAAIWEALAAAGERHGLRAGLRWHHVDADHLELPL